MFEDEFKPNRPAHVSEYAETCLQAIAAHGLGEKISIGRAFGLIHYLDYRPTYDVDAWWMPVATGQERQRVVEVIEKALRHSGRVYVRSWGDVVSIELEIQDKNVFSFQIAQRSAQLRPSILVPWTSVLLDSLHDLIAGKMTALVERGVPRDFRDIFAIC